MADFTDQNIQDTYPRVVQIDSGQLQDGTGSVILSTTELTSIQAIGDSNPITATEWAELKNIGSADISATEWGYVATMQNVSTTSTPLFSRLNLNGAGGLLDPVLGFIGETGSVSNPHIGYTRGGSMFFHEIGNPSNLAITFINQNGELAATIDNVGTYRSLLSGVDAEAASTATTATTTDSVIAITNNSTNESNYITFVDGASGNQRIETDTNLRYNPSTNGITLGQITASSNISSSGDIAADNAVFQGGLEVGTGNVNTDGLFIGGADRASIFNINGLRLQGDSQDPTQTATEHVTISPGGDITATGDISSSGTITADKFIGKINTADNNTNSFHFPMLQTGQNSTASISNGFAFNPGTDTLAIGGTTSIIIGQGNITASGDISASGNVLSNQIGTNKIEPALLGTANPFTLEIKSNDLYHNGSSLRTNGNITASGNISASGDLIANNATITEGYVTVDGSSTSHGFELKRDSLDTYKIRHLDGGLTIQNSTDNRKEMTFDGTGKVGIGNNDPQEILTVEGNISASGTIIAPSYTGQLMALDRLNYYITINSNNYFLGRNTGVESGDFDIDATSPFSINDEQVFASNILPVSMSTIGLRSGIRVAGGGTCQLWITTGSRSDWLTADTVPLGFGASGSLTIGDGQDFGTLDIPEFSINDDCDVVYVFVHTPDTDNPTVRITGQLYGRTR